MDNEEHPLREGAEPPPGPAAWALTDYMRADAEESLAVVEREQFRGRDGWNDIAEYIKQLRDEGDSWAGTPLIAWADRWEEQAQNPGRKSPRKAVDDLAGALRQTLAPPEPVVGFTDIQEDWGADSPLSDCDGNSAPDVIDPEPQVPGADAEPSLSDYDGDRTNDIRNGNAKPKITSVMGIAGVQSAKGILAAIDWFHRASLHAKRGERAVARTKRTQIPVPVRRRVMARQGDKCMYCGIDLLRINRALRHIDHVIPVEHGGPNEESNYQALCNRCNSRKGGHQTDEEFRERYSELLRNTMPGRPPTRRIPYERFDAVTRRTRQAESTVARRKAIFKTPAQKITASSTVAGAVSAIVWFFAIPIAFPNGPAAGTVAFFGAPIIFGAIWVASMWRAKVSGILDSERT